MRPDSNREQAALELLPPSIQAAIRAQDAGPYTCTCGNAYRSRTALDRHLRNPWYVGEGHHPADLLAGEADATDAQIKGVVSEPVQDFTDEMRRWGDEMQPEASRLVEAVEYDSLPYEAQMAHVAVRELLGEWSNLRRAESAALAAVRPSPPTERCDAGVCARRKGHRGPHSHIPDAPPPPQYQGGDD
jgi:hypothetical protein